MGVIILSPGDRVQSNMRWREIENFAEVCSAGVEAWIEIHTYQEASLDFQTVSQLTILKDLNTAEKISYVIVVK